MLNVRRVKRIGEGARAEGAKQQASEEWDVVGGEVNEGVVDPLPVAAC